MTETSAHNLMLTPAEGEAPDAQRATNEGVARATGLLALGNVLSRVLGLARVIVMTNLFGADRTVDALTIALSVPKALYDLLIGGHVNSAIIPVLSEVAALQGREALWRLVSVLCSIVAVLLSGLTLLLMAFAPDVMGLISASDPETLALATPLLRLTMPALIFMSLFAVLSGALYALRRFALPALAGAVFNGGIVLVTLVFAPAPQITPILTAAGVSWTIARPPEGIIVVSLGWLVGALAQLLLQLPALREAKLRLTLNWRHPAVRQIAILYAPVMFSLVVDTLINRLFSYRLAIQSGEGGAGYMDYATTLIQFPQGLVATAISIAILPTLSRQAALMAAGANAVPASGDADRAFKDTLGLGLRLATALIVPAAMGLFVMATPIIGLLFEHGEFNAADTFMTATALRLYLIGLPFAAIDLLLVYAFYARQDTLTPALIGVLSLVVYMLTAVTLQPRYGLFSLMIADSLKHITHALVSGYVLQRRLRGMGDQRLLGTLLPTCAASLAMSAVAFGVTTALASILAGSVGGLLGEIVVVVGGLGAGAVVFFALAMLLKIEELRWIASLVRARLGRA
jgi:putative peptidoglycan lipid II flippase